MSIPQEILDERKVLITEDDSFELVDELNKYNDTMNWGRTKMKEIKLAKFWFILLNSAIILVLFLRTGIDPDAKPLSFILIAGYLAAFILLALRANQLRLCSFFSALLIPVDLTSLIFFCSNMVLGWFHRKLTEQVMDKPDYPDFREIVINYQKHSKIRAKHTDDSPAEIASLEPIELPKETETVKAEKFEMPGLFDDEDDEE